MLTQEHWKSSGPTKPKQHAKLAKGELDTTPRRPSVTLVALLAWEGNVKSLGWEVDKVQGLRSGGVERENVIFPHVSMSPPDERREEGDGIGVDFERDEGKP